MTSERLARVASVLALAVLVGLFAATVTATPTASAATDDGRVAHHPTPTEQPTTTTESTPTGPPTGATTTTSTRDLVLVVGGFLTGGALVGVGVVAGRWST